MRFWVKDFGIGMSPGFALRLQSERRSVDKIKELEGLKALVVDDFNACGSVTKILVQTLQGIFGRR